MWPCRASRERRASSVCLEVQENWVGAREPLWASWPCFSWEGLIYFHSHKPSVSLWPSDPSPTFASPVLQSQVFNCVLDLNELLQVHRTANQINFLYRNPHLLSLLTHPPSHFGGLGNFWLFLIWPTNSFLFCEMSVSLSILLSIFNALGHVGPGSLPDPTKLCPPPHLQSLTPTAVSLKMYLIVLLPAVKTFENLLRPTEWNTSSPWGNRGCIWTSEPDEDLNSGWPPTSCE